MYKIKIRINIYLILLLFYSTISASDQLIQYLFPKPGSSNLPAGTEVLIRFQKVLPDQLNNVENFIHLSGDKSGAVSGSTTILSDQKTIRYLPDKPFQAGETVTMHISPILNEAGDAFLQKTYSFKIYDKIEKKNSKPLLKNSQNNIQVIDYSEQGIKAQDPVMINGVSIPDDFPILNILYSNNPTDGLIFLNHGRNQLNKYHMIMDNTGAPVWYLKSNHWDPRNFNLHANGEIALNVNPGGTFGDGYYMMDSTYTVTDSFTVNWNGYRMDDHEFIILEDGRYFMIGYQNYIINMGDYVTGGRDNVNVRETAIFGYPSDSKTPNFIWRAFDNFNVADTDDPAIDDLESNSIRFPHMNAIKLDTDGQILLSSRHLSEITKINYQTGEKIWRLGGKHNQFTFINDDFNGPSNQHDIQPLGDNHYSIFDNGNQHSPQISRAVEWEIDTVAMTATVVWEQRNIESNNNFSHYMGNYQRLYNGNRLINWAASNGLTKLATEVTPEGDKTLEFKFEDDDDVYRIFKYQWQGVAKKPYLLVEIYSESITLIFNKFGDNDIDHYNIYSDTHSNPQTVVATSIDPFIHLTDELVNNSRNYFRVTAVNTAGEESEFSNQESVFVRLNSPGENMIKNGDFENGFDNWEWLVREADADYQITGNNELHFIISDGGSDDWNVQALYPGISMIHEEIYLFEFDAYSTEDRIVYFDVRKNGDPWTNFSKIGGSFLTTNIKHYSYEFLMKESSEPEARVVLNVGGDNSDVYVDNVSLKQMNPGKIEPVKTLPLEIKLEQNYPNPFNPETVIKYKINRFGHIVLNIYNLLGQKVETLVDRYQSAGKYEVSWQPYDLANGIYFYRLQIDDFVKTKKMILQK